MNEEKVQVEMTTEEAARYEAYRKKWAEEEQQAREKADREAYRTLSMETVDRVFPGLLSVSTLLKESKSSVYDEFRDLLETKASIMGMETTGQRSHSFLSSDGTKRIILGYYVRDGWDDTAEDGVELVKQYVRNLVQDAKTQEAVDIIMELLARDGKGNLKLENILKLEQTAMKYDADDLKKGVTIIKEAYRPERTKNFIRAQKKNEQGKWIDVPLGMTEA